MTEILSRMKKAESFLAMAETTDFNYKTIGGLRDLLIQAQSLIASNQIIEAENADLMVYSAFTLKEARKRLNEFDYRIDNVHGTEFEVQSMTNANAYIVDFRPSTTQASCTCPDFVNRKRICKHITFVHDNAQIVA